MPLNYLLFNQRSTFILHINNRHHNASGRPIYVNKMNQSVDIFENCVGFLVRENIFFIENKWEIQFRKTDTSLNELNGFLTK